jgi:Xaa-Pro aminopeptidase
LFRDSEFQARRDRLRPILQELRASAFLITALPNVRYLSGFTGSNGAVLLTPDRNLLFTDPRYATQAPLQSDCEVVLAKGQLLPDVAKWIKRLRLTSLALEQNRISFEGYSQLRALIEKVRLKPCSGAVEKLRMIKSDTEIATIKASVQLNSAALEQALSHFDRRMTELDLAAEIDYRMRRLGAEGTAFDTIVASGIRSALPHAHPSDHPIETDKLLLIDMGATVAGYASDMTRTYAVGKLNPRARKMYRAVLESQLAAIDAIRPGVTCGTVDRVARTVLRNHRLEDLFIHSTGHGLGLKIHEGPRLGRKEKTRLEQGMTLTVEPGVYLEEFGGVRIEDTILVTQSGCEILTPTGKELTVV